MLLGCARKGEQGTFPTIEIGPVQISTYWLIYTIAYLVCGTLMCRRLVRAGLARSVAIDGVMLMAVGAAAGTFLLKGLALLLQGRILGHELTWLGGSAFVGALAGACIVALFYYPRYGLSLAQSFDLWILPVPLGQAIARLGCLAAGCCFGQPTDTWLGLYLPDPNGNWMVRYPTQLLASAADLLIFFVLLAYEGYQKRTTKWNFPGAVFLLYSSLYSLKRFSVEFLRGDALPPLVGPLNLIQLLCGLGFLASAATLLWNLRRVSVPRAHRGTHDSGR